MLLDAIALLILRGMMLIPLVNVIVGHSWCWSRRASRCIVRVAIRCSNQRGSDDFSGPRGRAPILVLPSGAKHLEGFRSRLRRKMQLCNGGAPINLPSREPQNSVFTFLQRGQTGYLGVCHRDTRMAEQQDLVVGDRNGGFFYFMVSRTFEVGDMRLER